jgi:hypothetical protein
MRFYVKEIFSVWSTVTRRSAVVYHQINHENLTGSSNEKNRKGKHSLAFILFFFVVNIHSISLSVSHARALFIALIFNMMFLMEVQDVTRVHEVLDNIYHLSFGWLYFSYSNRATDLSWVTLDRLIFRPIDIVWW